MPGPVVLDRDRDRAVRLAELERDLPPSGVARNAFESRLSTICSTRSPSETITGSGLHRPPRSRSSGPAPARRTSRRRARPAAPSRPPRAARVKRCASSFARSRMSPTSRSSRSASASTIASERARPSGSSTRPSSSADDVAADRRERRAQLVRDRHQEVPLARLRLLEPLGHLLEPLGQVPDLARRAQRHLDVVAAGRDLVGRAREREQRPDEPPRDVPGEGDRDEQPERRRDREPPHERVRELVDRRLLLRDDDRADRRLPRPRTGLATA